MKKALVTISLVALLVIPVVGMTGCPGGTTITDNDIATFRGLLTRMDSVEEKDATQDGAIATLNKGVSPDLSNYVTLDKYNELLAKYNNLVDLNDPDSLASQLATLKNNQPSGDNGDNTSPPLTGQVTVEITDMDTPFGPGDYYFFCKVSNGTNVGKKVYLQFTITPQSSPTAWVKNTTAVAATGGSFTVNTFTPYFSPTPDGSGISKNCTLVGATSTGYLLMASGGNTTVVLVLTLALDAGGSPTVWDVNITPIAVSW